MRIPHLSTKVPDAVGVGHDRDGGVGAFGRRGGDRAAAGGARLRFDLARSAVVKRRFLLSPGDGIKTYRYVVDFSAEAAQWVAQEEWHPQQQSKPQADGSLRMRIPYSDHTELVMDVLRHGPNVRVLAPPELVEQVRDQLQQTLAAYADKAGTP